MDTTLSDSPIHSLPWIKQIRARLASTDSLHLVGGAVRDLLLKREIHDMDFIVPQGALQFSRRVANQLGGAFYPLDKERETGRVIQMDDSGKKWHLDFAVYRGTDLDSDLRGRDFTINAMAIDLHQPGSIYDPLGGALDLHRKQLRTCTPASLEDDPVRILRAIRFAAAYQMRIEPETLRNMQRLVSRLGEVSPERLRDEFFRILEDPHPVICLRVLDYIGGLRVMFPELELLRGLPQPPPHTLDGWAHTLEVVSRLSQVLGVLGVPYDEESASNLNAGLIVLQLGRYRDQISTLLQSELSEGRTQRSLLFFAALFHDVGKSQTIQTDETDRIRFFDHDKAGSSIVSDRARVMHLSGVEIDRLKLLVQTHMRPILLSNAGSHPSRKAIYRFFRDTGEAGVVVCLLSLADMWGTYGSALPQTVWQNHLEVVRSLLCAFWEKPEESVSPPALINGNQLMAELRIDPGPLVGELLDEIREAQATGLVESPAQALDLARSLLAKQKL